MISHAYLCEEYGQTIELDRLHEETSTQSLEDAMTRIKFEQKKIV